MGSKIQRILRLFHRSDRYAVGIDPGRFQAGVTEEFLKDADVVIGLQQVGGKGVAEGV